MGSVPNEGAKWTNTHPHKRCVNATSVQETTSGSSHWWWDWLVLCYMKCESSRVQTPCSRCWTWYRWYSHQGKSSSSVPRTVWILIDWHQGSWNLNLWFVGVLLRAITTPVIIVLALFTSVISCIHMCFYNMRIKPYRKCLMWKCFGSFGEAKYFVFYVFVCYITAIQLECAH